MVFGHKILVTNESRMIGEEVRDSGCGSCSRRRRHLDFLTAKQRSQMFFVRWRVNAVQMCQRGSEYRSGRSRRSGSRRRLMRLVPVGLSEAVRMNWWSSRRTGGGSNYRGWGARNNRSWWRRYRRGSASCSRWSANGRRHDWRRIQFSVLTFTMSPQINFALESSTAVIAGERFVARVLPGVSDQVRGLAESLATHCALVRLLTCICE